MLNKRSIMFGFAFRIKKIKLNYKRFKKWEKRN